MTRSYREIPLPASTYGTLPNMRANLLFPRQLPGHPLGLATLLLAALAVGCSSVEDPGSANFSTVDVTGKVRAGGKPVAEGIIVFQPIAGGGSSQQATGEVQSGSFTLTSGGARTGAMPGRYRVNLETLQGQPIRSLDPIEVVVPDGGGEVTVAFENAIAPPRKTAGRRR